MFVGVARLSLQIRDSGSLKSKRQVLRKVIDRVRARFNVAMAEVEDQDVWQKATVALSVVGNERPHVNEQLDKIIQYVEDMYLAPLVSREIEILTFGDQLFSQPGPAFSEDLATLELPFAKGERSLAEAEGMAEWDQRHTSPPKGAQKAQKKAPLSIEERRKQARSLRNRREWEKG
jgi:uncharacterized protein YlxP (DUF503 family)